MRELQTTTEARVLLAIDSYNELFQPSMWHHGDSKVLNFAGPYCTASVQYVAALNEPSCYSQVSDISSDYWAIRIGPISLGSVPARVIFFWFTFEKPLP